MTMQTHTFKVENFDDVWGKLGEPALVEKTFIELLPKASNLAMNALTDKEKLEYKSIHLQMLSQLALAQAILKKFDEAHATLDQAQAELTPEHNLAKVRILCERGRAFQQAGDIEKARIYFERSYELSAECGFDKETINVAHMIAIAAKTLADKIAWNQKALDLALSTENAAAQVWRGPIWNNLGANYLEDQQYEKSLHAFEQALAEFEKAPLQRMSTRFAKFRIAQCLRSLGKFDQALTMLQDQLAEFDKVVASGKLDMPVDVFRLTRGWVFEELIEIYHVAIKGYAKLAYDDFTSNQALITMDPLLPAKLERLRKIKES